MRRQIVAEAEASDEPMSNVARRHGLDPNLLYSWRQQFIKDQEAAASGKEVCLLPVEVKATPKGNLPDNCGVSSDILEINLPCGSKLRCGSDVVSDRLTAPISVDLNWF